MVETSSTKDAFARRGTPAADRIGSGTDHFKRAADKAAGDRFKSGGGPTFDPARPKADAFAQKAGAKKSGAAKPVSQKAAPAKTDRTKPAVPPPVPAKPEAPARAAALAPAAAATVAEPAVKRAALHVVPSEAKVQDKPVVSADALVFGQADTASVDRNAGGRAEPDARQRPAAKSSSFVLMTGGGLATDSSVETLDKSAPVEAPAAPPDAETQAPTPPPPARPRSGGDGGGGGSGGDDGVIQRKRGLDQDDIAGILMGVVILALLLLWLLRGKEGSEEIAGGDPLLSTQFAATDTGPPETFTPQVDPFGDQVIDLKPTGPMPEPFVESEPAPADATPADEAPSGATEMAELAPTPTPVPAPVRPQPPAAAPPPVAATRPSPAALPGLTSHAWFCTGSAELTEAARGELLASVAAFRPHAGEPLVVHAFADTRGTSVYNLALSGERARVVADFLRTNGLEVSEFEGKGELDGLADGRNCANQRRADIFLKAGSEYRPSAACVPPEEKSAAICG